MREEKFSIVSNRPLTGSVYEMQLRGCTEGMDRPGQFVNIALPGLYLRRPISVCDVEDGLLTLVYKVVGKGTEQMAAMQGGDLNLLTGLGNGYSLEDAGDAPLLGGGGVGVPPLYGLARALRKTGREVQVILGFNTADEVFYEDRFRDLGCRTVVTTVDGSYGTKGFVTDAMDTAYSYFYACGPLPMLKAVYRKSVTEGAFSLEERMGCGFGACMGCSMETNAGPRRICKEGPVFRKEELPWQI